MLGLKARIGVPEAPEHPALACRVVFQGSGVNTKAIVVVSATDAEATAWVPMGKFTLP